MLWQKAIKTLKTIKFVQEKIIANNICTKESIVPSVTSVLIYTNQKITLRMENSTSNPSYGESNKAEMKALFGLLFLAGLFRSGRQSLIDL